MNGGVNWSNFGRPISLKESFLAADQSAANALTLEKARKDRESAAETQKLLQEFGSGGITEGDLVNALMPHDPNLAIKFGEQARLKDKAGREKDKEDRAKAAAENELRRKALEYLDTLSPRIVDEASHAAARSDVINRFPSVKGAGEMLGPDYETYNATKSLWTKTKELVGDSLKAEEQYQRILKQYGPEHALTKAALADRDSVNNKREQANTKHEIEVAELRREKLKKGGIALFPDGPQNVNYNEKTGRYQDYDGNEIPANVPVVSASIQALDPDPFKPKKPIEELQVQEGSAIHFRRETDLLIDKIQKDPDAITAGATLARAIGSVMADARGIAGVMGITFDTSDTENRVVASSFDSLKTVSAGLQTQFLTHALAYAKAAGLGEGRALTDTDLKRALTAVGAGISDADQAIAKLRETHRGISATYISKHKQVTGKDYKFEGEAGKHLTPKNRAELEAEITRIKQKLGIN